MEKIIARKREEELAGIRRRIWGFTLIAAVFLMLLTGHMSAYGAGGLEISTDYPGISVMPKPVRWPDTFPLSVHPEP